MNNALPRRKMLRSALLKDGGAVIYGGLCGRYRKEAESLQTTADKTYAGLTVRESALVQPCLAPPAQDVCGTYAGRYIAGRKYRI
ncbi:MAG: hypothetical protein ACTTKL_10470 [Treponema sp.]